MHAVVAAGLWLVASSAGADDTHYRSVPIGAHAIGLGGAFTGVVDDASAAFYNPGGLMLDATTGIAGGLTINAWDKVEIDNALENPDGVAKSNATGARTIPLFIGALVKFGPENVFKQKKFALALSVVEPNFSREGDFLELPSDPVELTTTYTIAVNDRATWYGLSFASRINLKHMIGTSLYLSVRRLNQNELGLALAGGTQIATDPAQFVGTSSAATNQRLNFKAFHLALRFGWLFRFKPQLQFGVMLQPPGIPLKQRVGAVSQEFVNDEQDPSSPLTTTVAYLNDDFDANLPIPLELRTGVMYWPAEKVMLALDAMFYGPVRSGQRVKNGSSGLVGGLFYDNNTARRAIGNVAVGADFFISKKIMIETGFFTDFSSAIKIPDNPDRYYNPQVNRYAGTISIGLDVAGVAFAVGTTFLYGKGPATGAVIDQNDLALGYTRTEATTRTIFLHLTGATRAVSTLSDKTAKGIKTHRDKKQNGDERTQGED
jgi:hypothetical protein